MSEPTAVHTKRMEQGWTLRDLAQKCADAGAPVHFTQLGKIDRGESVPNPKLRAVLARLLDIGINDFERVAS